MRPRRAAPVWLLRIGRAARRAAGTALQARPAPVPTQPPRDAPVTAPGATE